MSSFQWNHVLFCFVMKWWLVIKEVDREWKSNIDVSMKSGSILSASWWGNDDFIDRKDRNGWKWKKGKTDELISMNSHWFRISLAGWDKKNVIKWARKRDKRKWRETKELKDGMERGKGKRTMVKFNSQIIFLFFIILRLICYKGKLR